MPTTLTTEMLAYACAVFVAILGWAWNFIHAKITTIQDKLYQVEKELVTENRIKEIVGDKLAPCTVQFEYISTAINELRSAQASIVVKLDQLLFKKSENPEGQAN